MKVILLMAVSLAFSCDVSHQGVVESAGPGQWAAGTQLAYDALENRGKRRPAPISIAREDVHLRGNKHTRLQANASDTVRNFSVAAWALRRHLDYVARFEFQPTTRDAGFNKDFKQRVEIQSRPTNFDAGGRFGREKFFRLAEARRCLDGDTGVMLISNGTVQGIEADLIRQPPADKIDKNSSHEWVQGVEIDGVGYVRRYSVYGRNRGGIGYQYRRNVRSPNMILHGFFQRYASDQVRGVSPIVASLNNYRDLYENFDYALARAKLNQLFAMALTRKAASKSMAQEFPDPDSDGESEDENGRPDLDINLADGPFILDLDVTEDAKFLESSTPSDQFQAYCKLVCAVALKSLDIPYSFYDEGYTNYSGNRSAWLMYERACVDPRDDQIEMRRRWTLFQLQRWVSTGELKLPRGMSLGDVTWSWTPLGVPWWKPSEELVADLKSIGACLNSPQNVMQSHALGDPEHRLREIAEFFKLARDIGNEVAGQPLVPNFDGGPFVAELPEPSAGKTPAAAA